jgi:hypothetical protein
VNANYWLEIIFNLWKFHLPFFSVKLIFKQNTIYTLKKKIHWTKYSINRCQLQFETTLPSSTTERTTPFTTLKSNEKILQNNMMTHNPTPFFSMTSNFQNQIAFSSSTSSSRTEEESRQIPTVNNVQNNFYVHENNQKLHSETPHERNEEMGENILDGTKCLIQDILATALHKSKCLKQKKMKKLSSKNFL